MTPGAWPEGFDPNEAEVTLICDNCTTSFYDGWQSGFGEHFDVEEDDECPACGEGELYEVQD